MMNSGAYIGQMQKIGGLRAENAALRRERDALQQQVYDLAAKLAELKRVMEREQEAAVNIIHDLHGRLGDRGHK